MCIRDSDWAAWLADMNGAKVTVYVTNCGNGTTAVSYTHLDVYKRQI